MLGRELRTITTAAGGPQEAYDDVIFGDHGIVVQQTADMNEPEPRLQKIQTTTIASVRLIESRAYQNGADDVIFGNLGRDVIVAGAGHDLADGDEADDMVFGDNSFLTRRVVEPEFPTVTNYDGPPNATSGRFQALCGTLLYSRSDRTACGITGDENTSGLLLVNGVWQPYRDPDSPGIDTYPWWAEYAVDFDDENLSSQFHSFDVQLSVDDPSNANAKGAGSFGNDYLAGSQGHDQIFGEMGNDVIQGDGGIEKAFAAESHAGASRSPDGCSGTANVNLVCDYVGDLDIVPSFEASTDGEDYVEGGGGSDIAFGGLGQDDILGGSSDFFGLVDETLTLVGQTVKLAGLPGTWEITARSGSTLTLTGAAPFVAGPFNTTIELVGIKKYANVAVTLTSDPSGGGTLTLLGVTWASLELVPGMDRRPDGADLLPGAKYVTFNYDNYGAMKLVVRGVHQLDYTPGGPDFSPDTFFAPGTQNPVCNDAGAQAVGNCSTPLPTCAGTLSKYTDIGGRDEIHGEASDDTVYSGCGDDVVYGDAQDDDLVGGWGNDWLSGGAGLDGIRGDDGRIFTSRNTGCNGANCWQDNGDF